MAYVAVKGGEIAIRNAAVLLAELRRGDPAVPELSAKQIDEQLALAVDRVMSEGSLYDRELAALALKQAWGDTVEAIFLVRAFRTTLSRIAYSVPLETSTIAVERRISAIYKDTPGGQYLGATFDYTHRLLEFEQAAPATAAVELDAAEIAATPTIAELEREGLVKCELPSADPVFDLTREPQRFPAARDARLQNLARADEGFLLGLAYSTQRGYGSSHPFVGDVRAGEVDVVIEPGELGFPVAIGRIALTEVQMVNQFTGNATEPAQFTRGYGLAFGRNERKAMAMALVDRAMRTEEFGEAIDGPAQDIEFVLSHSDNVEAQGFVQHLKLPHYVDFQAELQLVRSLRTQAPLEADLARS